MTIFQTILVNRHGLKTILKQVSLDATPPYSVCRFVQIRLWSPIYELENLFSNFHSRHEGLWCGKFDWNPST